MTAKPACYFISSTSCGGYISYTLKFCEFGEWMGMASTHLLAPSLIDPTRPRKLPSQLLPLPFNGWLKFLLNWEIGRENFIKSFCCLLFNKAKAFGTTLIFNKIDETWHILACHSLSIKQKSVCDEGVYGWWRFAKPTCHRCLTAKWHTHTLLAKHGLLSMQSWTRQRPMVMDSGRDFTLSSLGSQWQVQKIDGDLLLKMWSC